MTIIFVTTYLNDEPLSMGKKSASSSDATLTDVKWVSVSSPHTCRVVVVITFARD